MSGLPRRPLGSSGLQITTVGFGSWAAGGGGWSGGWGPQDDEQSVAAIKRAVELGVSWIDTASVYGHGHSEELVGRAVRALPAASRPLIFTKCGPVWDDRHPMREAVSVLTPETVRRHAEESLRRLGVDTSTFSSSTGPTKKTIPSNPPGARWCGSRRRAWCGPSASRTSAYRCSSAASRSVTSTRCSRRSR